MIKALAYFSQQFYRTDQRLEKLSCVGANHFTQLDHVQKGATPLALITFILSGNKTFKSIT
jgi:hypothetical protein